jgi:hypothetical protein
MDESTTRRVFPGPLLRVVVLMFTVILVGSSMYKTLDRVVLGSCLGSPTRLGCAVIRRLNHHEVNRLRGLLMSVMYLPPSGSNCDVRKV